MPSKRGQHSPLEWMLADRFRMRETGAMDDFDFGGFYECYRAQCIRAGIEPLSPDAMQARIAEWQYMGLWWDTEPQKAGDDDNQREQLTH